MGKKSKRGRVKKVKSPSKTTDNHQGYNNNNSLAEITRYDSTENKKYTIATIEIPEDGWALELKRAERAVKTERNEENVYHAAKVLRTMRQWEKLKKLLSVNESKPAPSLSIWGIDRKQKSKMTLEEQQQKEKRQRQRQHNLDVWLEKANEQLSIKTKYKKARLEKYIAGRNIDLVTCVSNFHNNLNIFQSMAVDGDMRCMEKMVALGASLDYPAKPATKPEYLGEQAALGSTALVMLCAKFAMSKNMHENHRIKISKSHVDCAKQLVRLGANIHARLRLDQFRYGMLSSALYHAGFENKTAMELAVISGRKRLIEVMEQFNVRENAINLVHCRCGSRLPWKQCHAATKKEPHYDKNTDISSIIKWRLSPSALCPCSRGEGRTYYRCCWRSTDFYQNDSTGEITHKTCETTNGATNHFWNMLMNPDEKVKSSKFSFRKVIDTALLFHGPDGASLSCDPDDKSRMREWDPEVYSGIMERLEVTFYWIDVHWSRSEKELLEMASKWNAALEQYCDDKLLTGTKRIEVIKLHKASLFAPCGNLECDKYEKTVKEFLICSNCFNVGYCSRKCQIEHWKKSHKHHCKELCKGRHRPL